MKPQDLLRSLSALSNEDLRTIQNSTVFGNLPTDPTYYEEVVSLYWNGSLRGFSLRNRIVTILTSLAVVDGRSVPALLRIANEAYTDPELYGPNGCNSLAGLLFFLWRFKLDEPSIENLRISLNRFAVESQYLRDNALLCLAELAKPTP